MQEEDNALLRPLQDDFSLHWTEMETGLLSPRTERGQFHIERLHLNRPQLVEKRREHLALAGERKRTRNLEIARNELEQQVARLTRDIFGE